jgi:Amino acid permease
MAVYNTFLPTIGGSIGTGLFVGSGRSLAAGGPAGILIAWAIIGVMLINVTQVSNPRLRFVVCSPDTPKGFGRDVNPVPCLWWFLHSRYPLPRPHLRLRHGMELLVAVGLRPSPRNYSRLANHSILARSNAFSGVDHNLLDPDLYVLLLLVSCRPTKQPTSDPLCIRHARLR